MKPTFLQTLRAFAAGNDTPAYKEKSKSEIRHDKTWKKLKRVWNDGNGLMDFAVMHEGVLLINEYFCSKGELGEIKRELKIPYELVGLGYPDYYNYGLVSIRAKRTKEIEQKKELETLEIQFDNKEIDDKTYTEKRWNILRS